METAAFVKQRVSVTFYALWWYKALAVVLMILTAYDLNVQWMLTDPWTKWNLFTCFFCVLTLQGYYHALMSETPKKPKERPPSSFDPARRQWQTMYSYFVMSLLLLATGYGFNDMVVAVATRRTPIIEFVWYLTSVGLIWPAFLFFARLTDIECAEDDFERQQQQQIQGEASEMETTVFTEQRRDVMFKTSIGHAPFALAFLISAAYAYGPFWYCEYSSETGLFCCCAITQFYTVARYQALGSNSAKEIEPVRLLSPSQRRWFAIILVFLMATLIIVFVYLSVVIVYATVTLRLSIVNIVSILFCWLLLLPIVRLQCIELAEEEAKYHQQQQQQLLKEALDQKTVS